MLIALIFKLIILGSDGWKGDWISVHTDKGQYQCQLTNFLDGDDSEDGQQCRSF